MGVGSVEAFINNLFLLLDHGKTHLFFFPFQLTSR